MSVKSKLTKLAILGAVAGAITAAVKKVKGGDSDNWQSTYDPAPAPPTPVDKAGPGSAASDEPPTAGKQGDPLTDPLPPEDK